MPISSTHLLFIISIIPVAVFAQSCLLLSGSFACPAYQQYYIDVEGLKAKNAWLSNATDVPSFDQALTQYIDSTDYYRIFWYDKLSCNAPSASQVVPYARYAITKLCTELVQDSQFSLPCSFQHNMNPPPLCRETCDAYVDSLNLTSSMGEPCVANMATIQRNQTLSDQRSDCGSWPGLNGTTDQGCIRGSLNEPSNCGFGNHTTSMCLYCKSNSVDSCCNNINSQCPNQNKALSSGAIAGIVMGSIAAAALLAFGFIFFNKHKRRGHRISGYRAPYHHSSLVVAYLKSPSRTPSPEDDRDREIDPSTSNDNRESSMTSIENPAMVDFSEPEFSGYFVVKHPYVPQIQDELLLRPDDIVTIHIEFDDGWALGINRSLGLRGAFPLVCIASARPELVDQISVDSPEELEGYDTPLRSTAEDTLGRDALFSGDLSTSTGANTSAKSTAAQLVKRSLTLHTTNLALSTTHSPTAATDIPRRASSVRGHSSNTTTPHSGPSPITSSINLHQPSPARLRQHGSGVTGTGGGLTGEGGGGGADDPIEMQFTPHRSELQDSSNAGSTRSSGEEYSEGGRSNLDVSSPTSQTGLTFRK